MQNSSRGRRVRKAPLVPRTFTVIKLLLQFYFTRHRFQMYYTYLLESIKDKGWYIGYTTDLRNRFYKHNHGEVVSTKNRRPWKLIYYECYIDRIDAKKREKFLKSGSGRKFLKKQLNHYLNN